MHLNTSPSVANLNALAKLVSNASFQNFLLNENYKSYGQHLKKLLKKNGAEIENKSSLKDIINISYEYLLKHYRHEYLYKNSWLNSYVLKNYSLEDTVLLNEFRIGNSKADAVLVNGTNKVFEVKTELDNADRLHNQICDYYKAFSEVYIIVHHSLVDKYVRLVEDNVGIMTLNSQNSIDVFRRSIPDLSKLDISTMIKSLRKDEYLDVVYNLTGSIPKTKPVLLFKACLVELLKFSPDEVQYEFLKVLKNRINPATNKFIINSALPDSIRFSCYSSNLSENNSSGIFKRLNTYF